MKAKTNNGRVKLPHESITDMSARANYTLSRMPTVGEVLAPIVILVLFLALWIVTPG